MSDYNIAEYTALRSEISQAKSSLDQTLLIGFPIVATISGFGFGITNGFSTLYWPLFQAAALVALFLFHFAINQQYQILRLAAYIRIIHEDTTITNNTRTPAWETFLFYVRGDMSTRNVVPIHSSSATNIFALFIVITSIIAIFGAIIKPFGIWHVFTQNIGRAELLEVLLVALLSLIIVFMMMITPNKLKRNFKAYEEGLHQFIKLKDKL